MPHDMRAMRFAAPGAPLQLARVAVPVPADNEVLLRVCACGVCRTDLHIADGELHPSRWPLTPGHEVVGRVQRLGRRVAGLDVGERVGVPWLAHSCGLCVFCLGGRENLCERASFTGLDRDGGYADYIVADARYVLRLPERYDDAHVAPLLCAGLIGYRAYAMTGAARRLGLYGFGAAAHIIAQLAQHQGKDIYAFTRPGDTGSQQFARTLGARWAGGSDERPPCELDAAIIFASDGALVPAALAAVARGGTVVCAGIHMSDIPAFPYATLWGERSLRSVANLTRADGEAFFRIAADVHLHTTVTEFALEQAGAALSALRAGSFDGAAVLIVD